MTIQTDVVIIGAGPSGLFQVFELGLLDIQAHIVDSLKQAGGQLAELYPDKPIYDIPAFPEVGAQELVDRLLKQIEPFSPEFHLGQLVKTLEQKDDGRFLLETSAGTRFDTATVVLAAGLGAFQPRRLRARGAEPHEGSQIHYRVRKPERFAGRKLAILGGGDSALDWALELHDRAEHLTLIHRRAEYRAQPASVKKMKALARDGKLAEMQGNVRAVLETDGRLGGLDVIGNRARVEACVNATAKRRGWRPTRSWFSGACRRTWDPSPTGTWISTGGRSRSTPRNSRPACPAFSPWATSTPTPARRN